MSHRTSQIGGLPASYFISPLTTESFDRTAEARQERSRLAASYYLEKPGVSSKIILLMTNREMFKRFVDKVDAEQTALVEARIEQLNPDSDATETIDRPAIKLEVQQQYASDLQLLNAELPFPNLAGHVARAAAAELSAQGTNGN